MTPAIDLDRARRDTPGVAACRFFDSAGASLMPLPVIEAVRAHLDRELLVGGYTARAEAEGAVEEVYRSIATLIGARPDEIALTDSATRAWDQVFYGLEFSAGDRILTDQSCYGSNYLAFLQAARRTGVEIVALPDTPSGELDVDALDQAVDARTRLLALTWSPTASGRVNPAAAAGAVARRHDLPYLLDACQAVGQMPVHVGELQCDFLSATGRKYLRGPRGTGFLYVHPRMLERVEPAVVDVRAAEWQSVDRYRLRADARRYETWEMNYAAVLGLGAAVDYALNWPQDGVWLRIQELAGRLRAGLSAVPGTMVRDTGTVQGGIVTFTVAGQAAADIKRRLFEQDVIVSVSSPDGQLLDFARRRLPPLVRASIHYFNTEEEVEDLVARIGSL